MVLSTLLLNSPSEIPILCKNEGLLVVTIFYDLPNRERTSSTTINLRVFTTTDRDNFVRGLSPNAITAAKADGTELTNISIPTVAMNLILQSILVNAMTGMQSEDVIYRSVTVASYEGLAWSTTLIGSLRATFNSLDLIFSQKYRCGPGVCGSSTVSSKTNLRALVFDCYLSGMTGLPDKPGRILIGGTVFANRKQAIKDSNVESLILNLQNGYTQSENLPSTVTTGVGTINVTVQVCFPVGKTFHLINNIQVEGLSRVAGGKAVEELESLKPGSNSLGQAPPASL